VAFRLPSKPTERVAALRKYIYGDDFEPAPTVAK